MFCLLKNLQMKCHKIGGLCNFSTTPKNPLFWDGGQNYFLSQLRTMSKITLGYPTAFMPKRFWQKISRSKALVMGGGGIESGPPCTQNLIYILRSNFNSLLCCWCGFVAKYEDLVKFSVHIVHSGRTEIIINNGK